MAKGMKGGIWDLFFIALILFIFAVSVLVGWTIIDAVEGSAVLTSAAATSVLASGKAALEVYNYGFLLVFVGLAIATIVFAYMIPSHPIFIVTGILTLVVLMMIIPIYSNAYADVAANAALASAVANFNIMSHIMDQLPLYLSVVGTLVLIATYIKWRNEGTY